MSKIDTKKYSQKVVTWNGIPFLHCFWSHKGRWKVISTDIAEDRTTVQDFGSDNAEAIKYYASVTGLEL